MHSQINAEDYAPDPDSVSTDYSCHLWTKESLLVVASDNGDIMMMNHSGELSDYIP